MATPQQSHEVLRFGTFEVDRTAGELRKSGVRIRLQEQPFRILLLLLDGPGEIVTREQIIQLLWPDGTFVDYEHSINTAVRKLREALGDDPDNPRFIETMPRRGYRLIAPIEPAQKYETRVPRSHHGTSAPQLQPDAPVLQSRRIRTARLIVAGCFFLAAGALAFSWKSGPFLQYRGTSSPLITSIAVLPLTNLSGDPEQEYFADGMTDELITSISKIRGLKVISRTSVMQYKGISKPNKGLPAIARELNVDGVIEGTVLRSENRIRITVQLIHAASDTHVWAESYERDLTDVIALQDEVTLAVAHQIKAALTVPEQTQIVRNRAIDPRAYELYLKGRFYLRNRMVEKAAASFSEAVKTQPDYAEAYAGLGESFKGYDQANAARPSEAISRGRAAALRALEIDDSVAEAHAALAWARMVYDWDWAGAETEFRRALALNPNYETAHLWYGCELIWEKRFDEGLAEMKRAQEVAPMWQAGGLSDDHLALVRGYDYSAMSPESAAALFWYLRNSLYFTLGVHTWVAPLRGPTQGRQATGYSETSPATSAYWNVQDWYFA